MDSSDANDKDAPKDDASSDDAQIAESEAYSGTDTSHSSNYFLALDFCRFVQDLLMIMEYQDYLIKIPIIIFLVLMPRSLLWLGFFWSRG